MIPYSYSLSGEEKAASLAAWSEYESGILLCKDYSGIVPDAYKSAAVPEFSEVFKRLYDAGGWSTRRFATATGTSQSSVTKALSDNIPPPLEHLPKWAEALGLSGEEKADFIALGRRRKALAKRETRDEVENVYAQASRLADMTQDFLALVREFSGHLPPEFVRKVEAIASRAKKP